MLAATIVGLVVLNAAVTLGFVVLRDRADQRYFDELNRLRDERQHLYQRIQAPEMAVVEHAQRNAPEEDPNPYPKTEQEMAEAQGVTQAWIQRIEQMQADGIDMHLPQG